MNGSLHDKAVIITGASGGIGRACVQQFQAMGARVMMADVNEQGAQFAADYPNGSVLFRRTDLASSSSIEELIEATVGAFGRLDVLVNNAALIAPMLPVHATSEEDFDRFFTVNVKGAFLCCKYAYPHLRQTQGSIVNVSSMAGMCGELSHAAYCATKGALNSLTKAMAIDYGPERIRCNAVCPSSVLTPFVDDMINKLPNPQAVIEYRKSINQLNHTAKPEEIAQVIAFLASPEASFMTGAIIPVSGGSECGYGVKLRGVGD